MVKRISVLGMMAKQKIKDFFCEESGEVNIVATVVLIGIAVVLAILFRNQITNLLNSLFNSIENNAQNAIS